VELRYIRKGWDVMSESKEEKECDENERLKAEIAKVWVDRAGQKVAEIFRKGQVIPVGFRAAGSSKEDALRKLLKNVRRVF
jgi:hypothetical protein